MFKSKLMDLGFSQLGKKSEYKTQYDASLLFPIPRSIKRDELGIKGVPEFKGVDVWTGFEISWLNMKGKPQVRIAVFEIDALSECLIESKSFKLYLNSFNSTRFASDDEVIEIMQHDLTQATNGVVSVKLYSLRDYPCYITNQFKAESIDELDIEINEYMTNPKFLMADHTTKVHERLSSDLLKSNCLVTFQPDWGSVLIDYQGGRIDREGLLKYLVSFRDHNEFHEQCVERIYTDIMHYCQPEKLCVYARYTRRGGLDINPIRANFTVDIKQRQLRLVRQ
ncbi:NADPH-dependent 7-cyano-7-deazaguanine reductase QueF [Cysteiniphilum halobium]|uniref:NADPH-dependent 7-cyano-7-deazaguanine reductase QueF n=1 Tax=Cysteiniphilum halobium TaxID=2219059 RepID=UPI003F86D166